MPGKHLYEYAVIRVVPRVEREEFINVGIILYSKNAKYLKARYLLNEKKLQLFPGEVDPETFHKHLTLFDRICSGHPEAGTIAQMELPERFRFLTAVRSTSIQTSRPHSGYSDNLDETFEHLFNELVM